MSQFLKRILFCALILVILLFVWAYFFMPSNPTIKLTSKINCNATAANRVINYEWDRIFDLQTDTPFIAGNHTYKVLTPLYNGSNIRITDGKIAYSTQIHLLPSSNNTTIIQWRLLSSNLTTDNNLMDKLVDYFKLVALKKDMARNLTQIQTFLGNTSNVYLYKIEYTTLTDTVLVSTEKFQNSYPQTEDIYELVSKLNRHIALHEAKATNYPMLNILKTDSGYITMVGIPTNKDLPGTNNIVSQHLRQIKDKVLTAEIHGGNATIKNAYKQIEQFMQDHSLVAPVKPYELMITDRSKQKDTSKWVTKIFYPII